jgi:hypothetical protein
MAQMVENSSSNNPSVAGPQSPHLSHHPSFADPQLSRSFQLTGSQSPHPSYHPSFADRQSPHSPHPSQSFGSGASSALYHSPNAPLGGDSAYPTAPSSPDFLTTAPSNGYYGHASSPPQHNSLYGAIQAPVPASNYAWTPGNAGIEAHDFGQGLYRHYSPQFAVGQVVSPMSGVQDITHPNRSQNSAWQAGN